MSKKIILVDCFDTLIHRKEHPYQILKRWAKCINRLYPLVDAKELYRDRFQFIKQSPKFISEEGIYCVYEVLANKYIALNKIKEEEKKHFITDLCSMEIECESSVHYVNKEIISWLKQQKDCKVYCVTDYHFKAYDMKKILVNAGVGDIVEDVFSSTDFHKTKQKGDLYDAVLKQINVNPEECIMIGDNKHADIYNARKSGITTWHRSQKTHQITLKILNKISVGYGEKAPIKRLTKDFWKESNCYEEYVLILYAFCERLYKKIKSQNGNKVCFLAREGYFLKECFEIYQELCVPRKDRIKTDYLCCSRRAIHSVQRDKCKPEFFYNISIRNYFRSIGFSNEEIENFSIEVDLDKVVSDFSNSDEVKSVINNPTMQEIIYNRFEENVNAFMQYVTNKTDGDYLYLVDVGWIGRMQQGIDMLFPNISTCGYYVGIYDNLFEEPFDIRREGLIFNKTINGDKSKYFDIFRTNIQIYEQLLAAPHGSACYYTFDESGEVKVIEAWDEEEKMLYNSVICNVQNKIKRMFKETCCLDFGTEDDVSKTKLLAQMVLKSSLIQTKDRLVFMKSLNKGFSQNFQQQEIGLNFDVKKVQINALELIMHPERYVRYFAKVGVFLDKKKIGVMRYPINYIFYIYTRMLNDL